MSERWDVIVVGAGIGGCTCAALLARRGLHVLLLDQNARPGGKAMTVGDEPGFRYELWPIAGGPALGSRFVEVLEELGMADEVALLAPREGLELLYRKKEEQAYRSLVLSVRPDPSTAAAIVPWLGLDADEIPELLRLLGDMASLDDERLAELDDVSLEEFLSNYRLPQSVYTYFGQQTNIIFVVPLDRVCASEFIRTSRDMMAGGAGRYHSGGYGRVAEVFCQAIEKHGGRVALGERVERIVVEEGRVRGVETASGRFEAPIVVSNAGIQPTLLKLVGEEHFSDDYVRRVRELVPSLGIMGIRYFLDRPYFEHGMYVAVSDESYITSERMERIRAGELPDELLVFNVVPSFYDPSLAPEGKQCALVGTLCAADIEMPEAEALWQRLDETACKIWPGFERCVTRRVRYGTEQVSKLSRDAVVAGQGGECIGLAQVVGQCGRHKPSAEAPVDGLFYVGCDAGGYGCGTHQAADSGVNVAAMVQRVHAARSPGKSKQVEGE